MGSVRRASAWLGLVEDNDERYYDDEYAEGADSGDAWVTDPRVRVASRPRRRRAAGSPRCPRTASATPGRSASCSATASRSS